MTTRRELIAAFGAGALAAPFTAFAQQQRKVWRIGLLIESNPSFYVERINIFNERMRELGYLEGKDYSIEQRAAQSDIASLSKLATELVALKVDLILAPGTPPAVAARNVTREIPIVVASAGDPVGSGLVATLQRPGGNVTGFANGVASELVSKRLDLLRQMLPGIRRIGFLYLPENTANSAGLKQFEADCAKLRITSIRAPLRTAREIPTVFDALKRDTTQGLIVSQATPYTTWKDSIVEHARKHRLPAIYAASLFAEAGGLIAYGSSRSDGWRGAAAYVDKIFKGAKPGDLPIEQPTKFETVINLKTAKTLGIKIPDVIMLRADKVIE